MNGNGKEKEKKVAKKAPKPKAEKAEKTPKEKAKAPGVGVFATILKIIEEKGPITIEKIHAALISRFSDRPAEGLAHTIRAQLGGKKRPLRFERERKVKLDVQGEGAEKTFAIKK